MARDKDIEVNTEEISSIVSSAQEFYDVMLRANLTQMTMEIEALNATWEGPNHTAFVDDYETRKDNLETFHGVLTAYLDACSKAVAEYNDCESDVAQWISL